MLHTDAVDAQNRLVRIDLLEVLDRESSGQRMGPGLEFAADDVILETGVSNLENSPQVVGEDADAIFGADVSYDLCRGGAAVDKNDVALLDQGSGQGTDGTLLVRKRCQPLLIFGLERHALIQDRAPVRPFHIPVLLQGFQVSSDRCLRRVKQPAEIRCPGNLVDCQILLNTIAPLGWN